MTYEKKSVIELREIAKERKIKGISTLKKKELIETLEKYDQENYKEVKSKEETHGEHQGRKHYQKEFPKNIKSLDSGQKAHGILEVMPDGYGFIRCENYLPGENDAAGTGVPGGGRFEYLPNHGRGKKAGGGSCTGRKRRPVRGLQRALWHLSGDRRPLSGTHFQLLF